jgi:hypothetical protein
MYVPGRKLHRQPCENRQNEPESGGALCVTGLLDGKRTTEKAAVVKPAAAESQTTLYSAAAPRLN